MLQTGARCINRTCTKKTHASIFPHGIYKGRSHTHSRSSSHPFFLSPYHTWVSWILDHDWKQPSKFLKNALNQSDLSESMLILMFDKWARGREIRLWHHCTQLAKTGTDRVYCLPLSPCPAGQFRTTAATSHSLAADSLQVVLCKPAKSCYGGKTSPRNSCRIRGANYACATNDVACLTWDNAKLFNSHLDYIFYSLTIHLPSLFKIHKVIFKVFFSEGPCESSSCGE